jgi:two-component system, chemotaxis family, protein-glutamate methylesterase/glutaminase
MVRSATEGRTASAPLLPIVVLGASAGGVQALTRLVATLPADLLAAVFVVLHIPAHSRSELAAVLQRVSRLPVAPATDGEAIEPGRIRVAPPDRHLVLERGYMRLTRGPRECRARPAVDVLFRSAAAAYGPQVIAAVLSGALDDGTAGLWAVKDRGGVAFVQDPDTAEHPSMPEHASRFVDVDAILDPARLGEEIARRVAAMEPKTAGPLEERLLIETAIALNGGGTRDEVARLGTASDYTCPECHRVLVRIEEGRMVRFRCHNGHAFSLNTLLAEINASIDRGIWDAVRALEERGLLLSDLTGAAEQAGQADVAARCREQAQGTEPRVRALRDLVLDHRFLGLTTEEP